MASLLPRAERVRYARQISLPEIGERGQARLLAAERAPYVRRAVEPAVPDSAATALMYLERAGVAASNAPIDDGYAIDAARAEDLDARAGHHPALREAAAFFTGALDAVETLKSLLGVGTPLQLHDTLTLAAPSTRPEQPKELAP